MKKLFTLIMLCVVVFEAFGQLNWVYDKRDDGCSYLLKTSLGDYALLHGEGNLFSLVGPNGNMQYTNDGVPLPGNPHFESFSSLFELPNGIGAVTNVYDFDPASGNASGYTDVLLFDQSGQYDTFVDTRFIYSDRAVGLSVGDFILGHVGQSHVSRVSADGTQVWLEQLPGFVRDMALKQVDTLLFLTTQGLIVVNKDGAIANQLPAIKHQRIKTSPQNDIVCIQGDSVFLYSSNYDLIAQRDFLGDDIEDFDVADGRIAVLTQGDSVHIFDLAMQSIGNFQLVENARFNFISAGPQTVTLAGTERYGSEQNNAGTSSTFLKEYGFDGDDFGNSNDIGVVGIVPGPEVYVHESSSNYFEVILKDLAVTVRNYGNNPVSAFKLNRKGTYNVLLDSISLAPGEEQTFVLPEFKFNQVFGNPTGQVIDLCIWASHPDFRLDSDADNDTYCTSFLVNDKEVVAQSNLSVYPNPASDVVNFHLLTPQPVNHIAFKIMNTEGRLVETINMLSPQTNYKVQVWDWPAGMYYLQYLEAGNIMGVEKFVVVR
jgi:Secretion system C-terminal sorting domain